MATAMNEYIQFDITPVGRVIEEPLNCPQPITKESLPLPRAKKTNNKPTMDETVTITMSYDNFESAIVSFLRSVGGIPDSKDVIWTDFGIELNENGLVEFDMTLRDERQFAKGEHQLRMDLGDPLGR